MKPNRFVALAAIALLVVSALGAMSMTVLAQARTPQAVQAQTCDQPGDDAAESQNAIDADDVELQCGDQNEDGEEAGSVDGQDDVPSGTPAVAAEAAQKTAETYLNAGAATEVELDDENGQLVYSVEIGGTEVKVDAMTGAVLGTESGED
jgi:uncharacterized membrane protein YkoI